MVGMRHAPEGIAIGRNDRGIGNRHAMAVWHGLSVYPSFRENNGAYIRSVLPPSPDHPIPPKAKNRKRKREAFAPKGKTFFFLFLFFFLSRNRVSFCRCLRPPKENTKRKAPFTFCLRFRKENHKRKEYIRKDKNYPCSRNMTITK